MQPILSPSKVSVHLSSWDISRDFHFHSNLLIYIAANNWQDYIKSFSIHGWRKILFSWPKRDIIFLLSSWDIAILFDRLHRFELGAIRFPRIFFNSNTWYWDEKKVKLTNFIELAILEFGCPKRTHNTNSSRMPPTSSPLSCCLAGWRSVGGPPVGHAVRDDVVDGNQISRCFRSQAKASG